PHQEAQKSTIRGVSLARCLPKRSPVRATGAPENSADLQRPHLASRASRSAGKRFFASQWGQTTCTVPLMIPRLLASEGNAPAAWPLLEAQPVDGDQNPC